MLFRKFELIMSHHILFYLLTFFLTCMDAYVLVGLPGRFLFIREVSSWKCAQNCFDRADDHEDMSLSYRRKRDSYTENTLSNFDLLELQISHHLSDYCSKSLEELTCLDSCPESDVKRKLMELGRSVEFLACSDITAAVKTYKCVSQNRDMPDCITQNCKKEVEQMSLAMEMRAQEGDRVIPGKEFCSLENCTYRCMKKTLPETCGEHSASMYKSLSDFANIVQDLLMFDEKPHNENGILCVDRPIPETIED